MSYILYYSNYCKFSKIVLQKISKNPSSSDVHFICIDNREVENGKVYIKFENGRKIIMPENVKTVPSLLLLNNGFKVIDNAEHIIDFFKPKEKEHMKEATMNNMEPLSFGFDGGMSSVVSDNFSFLDQDSKQLEAKGSGGMRQMHSYMTLQDDTPIYTPEDDTEYNTDKKSMTLDQLKQQRENEFNEIAPTR
jgi:hypothetical protein